MLSRSDGRVTAADPYVARSQSVAAFVEAPLISIGFYVWFVAVSRGWVMQDFMTVRTAAHHVLHGVSPIRNRM